MGTPLHPLQQQRKQTKQDNCKDELPCDQPARHRLLCFEFDEGPEGRLPLRQPWLPVQLPHLCRLPWTGARQLPIGRLNRSSVVLRRPPSFNLPGPLPLRQVPKQPLDLRGVLHPPRALWCPPPPPACLHRPCPPSSCPPCPCPPCPSPPCPSPPCPCLHGPSPPAQPHPQRLHRSSPGRRTFCFQECSIQWEDFLMILLSTFSHRQIK